MEFKEFTINYLYPVLAFFSVINLAIIASELQKLNKK
jgi:hypothetical protein